MRSAARVALVLAGAAAAVVGLRAQNPTYATGTRLLGWAVVAAGIACWWVVFRRRGPRRGPSRWAAATGAVGLTAGTLVVLAGAGALAATWPCTFPHPATAALSGGAPAEPDVPTGHVAATDGTPLAYRAFVPAAPVATLVFYHGSGANSAAGYYPLGRALAEKYRIATYLVDLRGHGASGGPRGDAPTPQQVWADTATAVAYVAGRHPGVPEYVGGHSAGVGVVLNSLTRIDRSVAGYVFLAPDYGLHSDTEKVAGGSNFATVCLRPFLVNKASNGVLDGHTTALGFAYPDEEARRAGLVARYTVNMALAENSADSAAELRDLDRPVGMWIGAEDEVFDAAKVVAYTRKAPHATAGVLAGVNHLGVLDAAVDAVGGWITRR